MTTGDFLIVFWLILIFLRIGLVVDGLAEILAELRKGR